MREDKRGNCENKGIYRNRNKQKADQFHYISSVSPWPLKQKRATIRMC